MISIALQWAALAWATDVASTDECPTIEPETCPIVGDELSATEWLRTMSLDLRGNIPTADEYLAVESGLRSPEDYLDDWLNSPEFAARVVRLHRKLLYNNLGGLSGGLHGSEADLNIAYGDVYYRNFDPYRRSVEFPRGRACANKPATTTDRDGWTTAHPYWAPTTTIKICAPEANPTEVSASGQACGSGTGSADPSCGCGPDLR